MLYQPMTGQIRLLSDAGLPLADSAVPVTA